MIRPTILVLCLLASALAPSARAEDERPQDGGLLPTLGYSHFDVGRATDRNPTRLECMGPLGRALVKTAPIRWGRIEPEPPRGRPPVYDWADLDRSVLLWQLAGLEPVLVLSPRSPWASLPIDATAWTREVRERLPVGDSEAALAAGVGAAPPRATLWPEWERFVGDLVERYDGDRADDMPGLRRPVRFIQVLDRADAPSHWIGSPDEYMRLLHHAGLGAKKAFSRCRILHATVDLRVIGFDPLPDPDTWRHRVRVLVPSSPPVARLEALWGLALIERTLEMPRLYDVIPHVGSAHLGDDAVNLRFLRHWLDRAGGGDVDIWLVDNPLPKLGRSQAPRAHHPSKKEQQARDRWVPVSRLGRHPEHEKASRWFSRGRCFDLVRSYCTAHAAGARTVLFFPRADLLVGAPLRARDARSLPSDFLATGAGGKPEPGPLWHAWQQLVTHIGAHTGVAVTPLGSEAQSVVFELPVKRRHAWVAVLMLDSRICWNGEPDKPLPTRTLAVPLPNGRYVLESCRTGETAQSREVTVAEGMLILPLGPTPIYVIPQD